MLSFLKKITTSSASSNNESTATSQQHPNPAGTSKDDTIIASLPSWKDRSDWSVAEGAINEPDDECREIREAITGIAAVKFSFHITLQPQNHFHSDLLKSIKDPEKPNTLEDLDVITEESVRVRRLPGGEGFLVRIDFNPTVPHCSLASLIGLCLRSKVRRDVAERVKLDIVIAEGKHSTEEESNQVLSHPKVHFVKTFFLRSQQADQRQGTRCSRHGEPQLERDC